MGKYFYTTVEQNVRLFLCRVQFLYPERSCQCSWYSEAPAGLLPPQYDTLWALSCGSIIHVDPRNLKVYLNRFCWVHLTVNMICCVWLLVVITCVLKHCPILRAIRVCACISMYSKLWSACNLIHHENKSAMVLLSNVTDVYDWLYLH